MAPSPEEPHAAETDAESPPTASADVDAAEIGSVEIGSLASRVGDVFRVFWMLGLVAFGGPQAHVAILRDHLVVQRNWMGEDAFTELFAIGQGLPGPTSTQLVISTATSHAGIPGGLLAFFLWNLPGLVVLTTCGVLIGTFEIGNPWYMVGLAPAAISLVFKAAHGFGKKLDKVQTVMAACSCCVAILLNGDDRIPSEASQYVYPIMLVCGGIFTYFDSKRAVPFSNYGSRVSKGWNADSDATLKKIGIPISLGLAFVVTWVVVLVAVICLVHVGPASVRSNPYLQLFEVMYRTGSVIFGGGQVVLPLLYDDVVLSGWLTADQFNQGIALASAMPGPLFNFSAYVGAVRLGVPGALVAYVALFSPGIILIFAVIPFWARLRHCAWFRAVLAGLNATAIGLVGAACVLLWEAAVHTRADAIVFVFAGTLAVILGIQAPFVIIAGGIMGAILHEDAAGLGLVPFCTYLETS
mmetsp:Transcript_24423/g.55731  ORF Transcript_24423/g.55731 Transcript_24423/m.55731 type:complete len:469 (-) Transcript_24423:415-1821(-)